MKNWLRVYFVDPQNVLDHCHQFRYSSGGYIPCRSFLNMIWLCCIWIPWNERNHRLFLNKVKSIVQLFENVKITSLNWLKANNVCFPLVIICVCSNPFVCLGVGRLLFFICIDLSELVTVILFCFFWYTLC